MTASEWHGWRTPEGVISIKCLPGRTAVSLNIERDGAIKSVAYFHSDISALETMKLLDLLAVGVVDNGT